MGLHCVFFGLCMGSNNSILVFVVGNNELVDDDLINYYFNLIHYI